VTPDHRDTQNEEGDLAETHQGKRPSRSRRRSKKQAGKKHLPIWQESLLLLGVALVLAVIIKALFVQAFYIPSESMEPGLVKDDRILVQKWSYWGGGEPQRGDVVVFKDPGDWLGPQDTKSSAGAFQKVLEKIGLYPAGGHLVKRVIGVGGDTIKCCDKSGRISVNGVPLEEPYLANAAKCNGPMPLAACTEGWSAGPVPKGHIFVMGDHRDLSADSSFHMCRKGATDCVPDDEFVSANLVVGKVFVLVWPRQHFGWVKRPATFEDIASAK
jgi:signal peptidase I